MLNGLDSRWDKVHGWNMHTRFNSKCGQNNLSVVFVHGLFQSSRYFIPLADRLAKDFQVFYPIFRGMVEARNLLIP